MIVILLVRDSNRQASNQYVQHQFVMDCSASEVRLSASLAHLAPVTISGAHNVMADHCVTLFSV